MSSDTTPTPTPPGRRTKPKPSMSRLMRLSLKAVDWATDSTRRADGTLNRLALSVLDLYVPAFSSPCRGVASRDVLVHPPTCLRARLFYPAAAGKDERLPPPPLPVIVLFHGGGFAFLSAASAAYDVACKQIARYASAAVLSVDYRRAPKHRCPAAYDDGITALRYLDDPKNYGGGGGGAGAVPPLDAARCYLDNVRVASLIAIQPFFGSEERTGSELRLNGALIVTVSRTDWMWRVFLPDGCDCTHDSTR
uniref:Alpha/beta hydrolase fold-3 domain-containing protein n=1 Tax=Oryza meridionalis TaxID=40149 RepID=A0A0E0EW70_9ORYZ